MSTTGDGGVIEILMLRDLPDRRGSLLEQGRFYTVPDTAFYRDAAEKGYLRITEDDETAFVRILKASGHGLMVTAEGSKALVQAAEAANLPMMYEPEAAAEPPADAEPPDPPPPDPPPEKPATKTPAKGGWGGRTAKRT